MLESAATVAWRARKAKSDPCGMPYAAGTWPCVKLNSSTHALAERYRRFAENEARDASPLYQHLALHVSGSGDILDFLMTLPADRQQPNLFLAAVRHAVHVPRDGSELERLVASHGPAIARVMRNRTTQTNEPARCAVMLPLLARLPQPLALIEVGASAGLCLLPDRYGYDYGRMRLHPAEIGAIAPVFPCAANDATPLPTRPAECGLARGARSQSAGRLRSGRHGMAGNARLAGAAGASRPPARRHRDCAPRPAACRPGQSAVTTCSNSRPRPRPGAQLVIFHTAVLAYIGSQSERDAFADLVRDIDAVWISNEMPGTFPRIAAQGRRGTAARPNSCCAVNGEPVAWTGPHGQSIDWFGD